MEVTNATLLREILKDPYKRRYILRLWIRRLNVVTVSVLSKLIYQIITITVKIPAAFLVDIDKLILKFTWEFKGSTYAKNNFDKEQRTNYLVLRFIIKV